MKNQLEFYSQRHPINKFISVTSNEVVTVKTIELYDCELDDTILVNDPEIISAYCYYELNVFDEYSIESLDTFVRNKNKNWEIKNIIYS